MTQPTERADIEPPVGGPRPFGPGRGRVKVVRELLLVAVLALVTLGGTAAAASNQPDKIDPGRVGFGLLTVAVLAVPLRYRSPIGAWAVVFSATLTYISLGYANGPLWAPLIITFGYLVMRGHRRWAIAALVLGYLGFPWLGYALDRNPAPDAGLLLGLAAWLITLLSVAEVVRSRRARAFQARLSAAEAERRRVTEERLRIARDLHDVVAHNMSLISIQAGVALHLLDQDPEQARESLTTIKQASREALVELRSVLGVLRQVDEAETGDDSAPRTPVPGLAGLDELVDRARAAAVHVRVDAEPGALDDLPRPVDLAAYRIVQESLTNVARHSHDRAPVVRLRRVGQGLQVEVLDEGVARPRDESVPGSGHGIVGMRERAESLGGWLEATPRPGRGFVVRAWLPIDDGPAGETGGVEPEPETDTEDVAR